jgi:hypothetical protein
MIYINTAFYATLVTPTKTQFLALLLARNFIRFSGELLTRQIFVHVAAATSHWSVQGTYRTWPFMTFCRTQVERSWLATKQPFTAF